MRDIKSDFKKWLQEHFSKSTAYRYYGLIQNIFDKNFGDNKDWQQYYQYIMPLLVRYFEFANREYYLDRVTIWYALDYFKKIDDYIQYGHLKSTKPDVDIYIFDGDKNYFVCSTGMNELYDNVVFIQRYLFESTYNLQYNEKNLSIDALKLVILLKNIKETGKIQDLRDAAIYIAYNNPNNSAEKTALCRYCDFMYALTANPAFDYKANPFVYMATNNNPLKHLRYTTDVPITGEHAEQIKYNYNPSLSAVVLDYVLTIQNLKCIFMVSHDRAIQLMDNIKAKHCETVKDKYYSIKAANLCLKEYYKSINKKYEDVNYKLQGYEYWITRKDATKVLNISHNAFDQCVNNENCSHINYSKLFVRYYKPDLEHLLKNPETIKSQRRKKAYSFKIK